MRQFPLEIDDLKEALRLCDCWPCDVPACNCGSYHRRPSKADREHDELVESRSRLLAALRAVEFTHSNRGMGMACCPYCAHLKSEGHAPGCVVAAALEDKP